MLREVVSEYSANLDWDAEWAGDWSTGDDWHSRLDNTWIAAAMGRGLYSAFDIGIPFSDATFNPLDAFAGEYTHPTSKSRIHTPHGVAKFTRTVEVDGMRAVVFRNPKRGRNVVRFDQSAIKAEVTVTVSHHRAEVKEANALAGYITTPRGFVWHHHWEKGVMQLVPRDLHRATGVGHVGRAQFW